VDLSTEHRVWGRGETVDAETARVQAAGGWVADGRVCDVLAVSRAFGDREFKGDGLPHMMARGVECAPARPALLRGATAGSQQKPRGSACNLLAVLRASAGAMSRRRPAPCAGVRRRGRPLLPHHSPQLRGLPVGASTGRL